jgi:hypothetical protein
MTLILTPAASHVLGIDGPDEQIDARIRLWFQLCIDRGMAAISTSMTSGKGAWLQNPRAQPINTSRIGNADASANTETACRALS